MSKVSSNNVRQQGDFYTEPSFVSVATTLRKISGDDTIPQDAYVSAQRNLYDLIVPEEQKANGGVMDIQLSSDKTQLIITYADSTTKNISVEDLDFFKVFYTKEIDTLSFIFGDGETLNLKLSDYVTKDEVANIRQEIIVVSATVETIHTEVQTFQSEVVTIQEQVKQVSQNMETVSQNFNSIQTKVEKLEEGIVTEAVENVLWGEF